MGQSKGFSLIELMVVVAIVAILAAIAIPSYSSSIEKSRRSDAKSALAGAVALQERQYSLTNQYSVDMSILGGATSSEGFYSLSVAYTAFGGACTSDKDCYTLTATAVGSQASDTACAVMTVDSFGKKAPSGSSCW